jgi:molybdopterin synthase catalytic subunit
MSEKKSKSHLHAGPIPPDFVARSVQNHQRKTDCGAHAIYLGQVRADQHGDAAVTGIEYSAYDDMANAVISEIREEAFAQWKLRCLHIDHSVGFVPVGEISMMVMVSAAHREPVYESLEWLVEQVKARVPIWKKEQLSDGSTRWAENRLTTKS